MSLALYMDVHVPRAITRELTAVGVDVLTAQEDGCSQMPDPELLDRAGSLSLSLSASMISISSRNVCLPMKFPRCHPSPHPMNSDRGSQIAISMPQKTRPCPGNCV